MGYNWQDILDWPDLDDGQGLHARVDAFDPNPFGLFNVHGNVLEWCQDGYLATPYLDEQVIDPVFPPEEGRSRVIRGGSFSLCARMARSSFRADGFPALTLPWLGVRPARKLFEMPEDSEQGHAR